MTSQAYDRSLTWNSDVRGDQVLPLINDDAAVIRVQAGPGSGKTFGLVRRVHRLLDPAGKGARGEDVLVVAFNRVIARDLERDIVTRLDDAQLAERPVIRTVHALCLQAISGQLRLLLPHEREALLYDVLTAFPVLKERYRKQKQADQALADHEAKHSDETELWQAVKRWLRRHNAQLISELPALLLAKLHAGDVEVGKYRYVIVDEYQDLTPGEQELFLKLRQVDGQFVALGDPKQSIYRFRGNDKEGLSKLENLLRGTGQSVRDVLISRCERCPSNIVDASNKLMSLYPPPMDRGNDSQANVHFVYWKTPQAEAAGMANVIANSIEAHPHEKHLVMASRRQFGFILRDKLLEINDSLSVDLSFSESLLETWAVREAFLFFNLLMDPDAVSWRSWLGYKNSVDGHDYKAPCRNSDAYLKLLDANNDNISTEVISKLAGLDKKPAGNGGSNLLERAKRFGKLKEELDFDKGNPEEYLAKLFDICNWPHGPGDDFKSSENDMGLAREMSIEIFRELRQQHPGKDAVELLKLTAGQLRYKIATREPFSTSDHIDLQVTTLWGAKGVTADHVYILGLCAEAVPGTRRREYPGTDEEYIEEQRRLFYVSITRARRTLVLSRARGVRAGEAAQLGLDVQRNRKTRYGPVLEMSPFLQDIIDCLPMAVKGENWGGL